MRESARRRGPFWEPNATGHCSRWFQRFGRIPGSLNIYYAISTCWYIQMTATYTLLQVLSRHSAVLGVIHRVSGMWEVARGIQVEIVPRPVWTGSVLYWIMPTCLSRRESRFDHLMQREIDPYLL